MECSLPPGTRIKNFGLWGIDMDWYYDALRRYDITDASEVYNWCDDCHPLTVVHDTFQHYTLVSIIIIIKKIIDWW